MTGGGVFITFEGGEGVGKSTQIARLAKTLAAEGRSIVTTREPGGTPGAEAIRALMLDPATALDPLADAFLVFAARADHVAKLIRPALARDAMVLCDRFTDSTIAYQGHGLGVDRAVLAILAGTLGIAPDLTFILDLPVATSRARLAARGIMPDRYERFDDRFAGRMAQGFRDIAASDPERCVIIDGARTVDAIAGEIASIVQRRYPQ